MRSYAHRCLLALSRAGAPLLAVCSIACAGSEQTAHVASTDSVASAEGSGGEASAGEVERLERERLAQERRIRELESRLALSSAEARDLRSELDAARERGAVIRIGGADHGATSVEHEDTWEAEDARGAGAAEPEAADEALEAPPPRDDDASRPVLRLYGSPEASHAPIATAPISPLRGPEAPRIVPPPPRGALGRLPVVSVEGAEEGVPAIPETPLVIAAEPPPRVQAVPEDPRPRAPDPSDPIVAEYRAALAHLTARRYAEAIDALGSFLASHASHPYAPNALYWRGEAYYAQRDYASALRTLEDLVARFPQSAKVPDAMLRIGFCHQRRGDRARARETFERLRARFPESVAARMAPREDA